MARKLKVWRFQRSRQYGDVVTAMTHDRQQVVHLPLDLLWEMNFAEAFTFYADAEISGTTGKPRIRVYRHRTKEEWK